MRRLLLLFLATLAVAIASVPGLARADDDDGINSRHDNEAVVENRRDNSERFDFEFSIVRQPGATVDETNVAYAYASCESCRSVAIAIQIVLVTGKPKTVVPYNLGLAFNENCTRCESFASAHQFVIGKGGKIEFTDEGEERLEGIAEDFEELEDADLTLAELDSRTGALVGQVKAVIATELVPVGGDDEGEDEDDDDKDDDTKVVQSDEDADKGDDEDD